MSFKAERANNENTSHLGEPNDPLKGMYERHVEYVEEILKDIREYDPGVSDSKLDAIRERHIAFHQESFR